MKKDYSKLEKLFKSMLVLNACTFGGGFVIVSLMKKKFVDELKWFEEEEMLDMAELLRKILGFENALLCIQFVCCIINAEMQF